jgi:hemerythrin
MRILSDLIEKAEDTLDEVFYYAEKAHHLKIENKALADTYIKIAEMHIDIYKMLHERMVVLINEKRKTTEPPKEMLAIWDYEHEKLIKEFNEAKMLVEEYNKSY